MPPTPYLEQIALSCIDLVQTAQWFRDGLGLVPAGGTRLMSGSPFIDGTIGRPDAEAVRWNFLAANQGFRLALYQFAQPLPCLLPANLLPSDIGCNLVSFYVPAFDETVSRLSRLGSPPIGPILGRRGQRHACVRNPDGLFVELMEHDPCGVPSSVPATDAVTLRSVSVSVPDLAVAIDSYAALTGTGRVIPSAQNPREEALWGLSSSRCERAIIPLGEVSLELVHYLDPVGRPKADDRRLSDQGTIALGVATRTRQDHAAIVARIDETHLYAAHPPARETAGGGAVFLRDISGSLPLIELAWRKADALGFRSRPVARLVPPARWKVRAVTMINASLERVWYALNDHDRMGIWIQADEFYVTLPGTPNSAGYGAERLLVTYGRRVLQQVTRVVPGHIEYRAIAGTPFNYHNGTVDVRAVEGGTELEWTIRFRTASPPMGAAVYRQLQPGVEEMLEALKTMVEAE